MFNGYVNNSNYFIVSVKICRVNWTVQKLMGIWPAVLVGHIASFMTLVCPGLSNEIHARKQSQYRIIWICGTMNNVNDIFTTWQNT